MLKQAMVWIMIYSLAFGPGLAAAQSNIQADKSAPGYQQPQVLGTAGGVPQVNINTPNQSGLSHNKYQQFDVDPKGLILNNSNKNVQTQLGGWIEGNPNLAGGTAKTILNEVNSSKPSQLKGFVEVGGQKADVIIANPSGINVDGGGFINAGRATLTTGQPQISGGQVTGYRVEGGHIEIKGQGLNGNGSDYTAIISQSAAVNAGIWAKDLTVTTGRNTVSADGGSATALDPNAPKITGVALDVSELGGMYAGQIKLIGTDKGLGVRNAGGIVAQVGEVVITNDGRLVNAGTISGKQAVRAETKGSVKNTTKGRIQSEGTVSLKTARKLNNKGQIVADRQVELTSKGQLVNSGGIQSGDGLALESAESVNNRGQVLAMKSASIKSAGKATNSGELLSAGDLSVAAAGAFDNRGQVLAMSSLSIASEADLNNSGELLSAGRLTVSSSGSFTNAPSGRVIGQDLYARAGAMLNTGLIDGSETVIQAGRIENVSTGTIFGDHLALEAVTILNGLPMGEDGTGAAGVIGARNRLDTAVTGQLTNREDGLIYSGGDWVIGGALDGDYLAVGQGGTVLNSSAVIDILGSIYAQLDLFKNYNAHYLPYTRVIEVPGQSGPHTGYTQDAYLNPDNLFIQGLNGFIQEESTGRGASRLVFPFRADHYFRVHLTREIQDTILLESRPGFVYAGGDFTLKGDLVNDRSLLEVGGDLRVEADRFENIKAEEPYIITDQGYAVYSHIEWANRIKTKHKRVDDYYGGYNPAPVIEMIERDVVLNGAYPGRQVPDSGDLSTGTVSVANLNLNLYSLNPSPTSNYLIESNPRLTDYRVWLSSDFMLARMNADPSVVHKRLGDGFYEQRLVREQIASLTGLRYLGGYASDEEQYMALMTAGVELAEEFGFQFGLTLSAEQMALLTCDIVWMEYVTVETADGPVQVLAPKVYLAPGAQPLITPGSGVISAKNISLDISGDIDNSGNILAGGAFSAIGETINNIGGDIQGALVSLAAFRNINIDGGQIIGRDAVQMLAGGDLNIASSTTATGTSGPDSGSSRTAVKRLGLVLVTGDNGSLVMEADGDIKLSGARAVSNGSASLQAGGDINVAALELAFENQVGTAPQNHSLYRESSNLQSDVAAVGNLEMSAGRDIKVVGSQVRAGAVLDLTAGGDLSVVEARDDSYGEGYLTYSVKNFLNKKSTAVASQSSADTVVSSDISGGTVNLTAGGDFNLSGSRVTAVNDLSVQAGGDINIAAAENHSRSDYSRVDKKSGIWGTFDLTSLDIKAGKLEEGREDNSQAVSNTASSLVSRLGDITLYAGKDVSIKGSAVSAQSGDLSLSGENVAIENVFNLLDENSREYRNFKGLTLKGGPTGAMKTLVEKSMGLPAKVTALFSKKDQERLDQLNEISKIGQDAYDIFKDAKTIKDAIADKDIRKALGVSAELSYGTSSSEATEDKHQSTVVGSELYAAGNINITARGDSAGEGGDLNVIGSRVEAEGLVNLDAARDLNLLSAGEVMVDDRDMKTESSSGGIKFNFGAKGWGFSVTGKYDKATEDRDRNYAKHMETVVSGGEGVNFASGNDSTLRGAVVEGGAIVGNVGGDLNIISEQDQDEAHQKNKKISVGIEIPVYGNNANFSLSFSKEDQEASSQYLSVNEQSGIFAGEGGFDITVGGNTALVGAVIDSEAEADKNQLTTGTLVLADLQNKSHYEAESSAWGLGVISSDILGKTNKGQDGKEAETPSGPDFKYDTAKYNPGLSVSFPMTDEGGDSSVTRSAIAPGGITISDSAGQEELTGLSSAAFIAALNRDVDNAHNGPLADNPDLQGLLADQKKRAEKIKSYIKDLQTGIKILNEEILNKDYAKANKKAQELSEALGKEQDQAKRAALQAELAALSPILNDAEKKADYEKWMPGGDYRTAIQVVGTLAAVQYGGGDTLDAFIGMAVGYLASQSPTLKDFATYIAMQSSSNTDIQQHTYDQIMEAFSLLGASVGGNSGQAAFQEAQPDQKTQKQLQEERKRYKEEKEAREKQQQASLLQ